MDSQGAGGGLADPELKVLSPRRRLIASGFTSRSPLAESLWLWVLIPSSPSTQQLLQPHGSGQQQWAALAIETLNS